MLELKIPRFKYMRDLEEVLQELKNAEKEYAKKCKMYGIEEKGKKSSKEEEQDIESEK